MTFKIDTGADTTVMSDETYYKLKQLPQLESDDTGFDNPGGKLEGLGQVTALTMYKGQKYKFIVQVVKTASCSKLLGQAAAVAMGEKSG